MNRLEIFQKVYGADYVFTIQELEHLRQVTELIVKECADVAKETRWAVPPSQEQIARGIQQHFGVKE